MRFRALMKTLRSAGALLLACPLASAQTQLTHVRVETERAAAIAGLLEQAGFDVLQGSIEAGSFEVIVGPEEQRQLELRGLEPITIAVGRPFNEIQRERALAMGGAPESVPGYSNLAEIQMRMSTLAAAAPGIAQYVNLTQKYASVPGVAQTFEGRDIFAVKISDNVTQDENEPTMLIVAAYHCREVVTPEIALKAIENLTAIYGNPAHPDHLAVKAAVDEYEIWVAPVWNPDGYNEVFVGNNLWRKNMRVFAQGVGVDLNRNHEAGWASSCGGSPSVSSESYKGPSAASEAETRLMIAFHEDKRFTKLIDYHSFGREVLWSYGNCWQHPLNSFLQNQAIQLSAASGYGGKNRRPSANGENFEDLYFKYGSNSLLIEAHVTFQPAHASALAEADMVWPGILWMLARPISISGSVTDACRGQPLSADVSFGLNFTNGETNTSGGKFGRYQMFLPGGAYTATFSAPGYVTQAIPFTIGPGTQAVIGDVALFPAGLASRYCTAKVNSCGGTPQISSTGTPSASSSSGFTVTSSGARTGRGGLLIYTDNGRRNPPVPFSSGLLCINTPIRRSVPVTAAGGTPNNCDATVSIDMNAFAAGQLGGNPQGFLSIPGTRIECSWWGLDTTAHGAYLSDALTYTVCQ